jgi:tRNA dimethylallyltransferase
MQASPIFLAGPTGAGKSEFAAELASRINGEVVGADAFQIYSELPILTAQPEDHQRRGITHHMIGCVPIGESYNVQRYREDAIRWIEDIFQRGKIPLVVGGTGLYFQGLIQGLDTVPASSPTLRNQLEQLSLPALLDRLNQLDSSAAEQIDISNPRRVMRAIEICELSGQPLRAFRRKKQKISAQFGWVLLRDRDDLHHRSCNNVDQMWVRGVVGEVARARDQAGSTASKAIGFREIIDFLNGKLTENQCRQAICAGTRQYAKRQLTWLRNQTTFGILNLSLFHSITAAVEVLLASDKNSSSLSDLRFTLASNQQAPSFS